MSNFQPQGQFDPDVARAARARYYAIASAIFKARQSADENNILAIAEHIRESEFDLMRVCRAAMLQGIHWEVMRAYEIAGTANGPRLIEALGADFVEKTARILSDAGEGMLAIHNPAAPDGTTIRELRGQSTSGCATVLIMGIGLTAGLAKTVFLSL